jgi:hypothetical protein
LQDALQPNDEIIRRETEYKRQACAESESTGTKPKKAARTLVALLPVPGNVTPIVMILGRIRGLDEFQKRVRFEAVTVAFLSTGVAVFVYGYFQKAHAVGPLNMGLVWAFMILFYAVGHVIAVNHYK